MILRDATESDVPGIAEVLHGIVEIKSIAGCTVEQICDRVAKALAEAATAKASTILVAIMEDETIAGYCAVHWVPFLFFTGPEGYVSELFVRQNSRSEGVGSALLDEVKRRAMQRGCTRLSLLNGRDGEAYRRGFYAKRNWQERDRMANFILSIG
jgi:GNAT superfamily N-acetyltransferase